MAGTADPTFVRKDMLPPQAPPVSQSGAIRWVRENLFSSWLNAALTILGLIAVYLLVRASLPWSLNGVWHAGSLGECRSIIAASAGEGASGACWAVIPAWWQAYVFGFYPPDQLWRPVLAFGLLLLALAPVLFAGQRRNLLQIVAAVAVGTLLLLALSGAPAMADLSLIVVAGVLAYLSQTRPALMFLFTAVYPALCFWLLWGGSFWVVISFFLALGLGAAAVILFGRVPSLNILFAVIVALGSAILATSVVDFVDTVGQSMWTGLSHASFYPGYFSDSGPVLGLLGVVLSVVVWLVAWIAWVIVAVIHAVGWVADLDLTLVIDSPYASYVGIGSALAAAGGFVAARNRMAGVQVFAGLVIAAAYWVLLHPIVLRILSSVAELGLTPINSDKFGGFLLSITIGVTAIGFSLPIGIILALGRKSDMLIVKALCVAFIEFIRGVPLITLLFSASLLLQYFLPPGSNFDIILRVIILVTLFAAAYLAEVIRGGLAALPRGQYEGADALGLDYWQAQRLVILPQALKISIPGIVSSFIGLFKDTTLVSLIGLYDPLKGITAIVRADINWKGIYWEPYIFVGVIFFVICFSMSRYSMYLERKLKTDHR